MTAWARSWTTLYTRARSWTTLYTRARYYPAQCTPPYTGLLLPCPVYTLYHPARHHLVPACTPSVDRHGSPGPLPAPETGLLDGIIYLEISRGLVTLEYKGKRSKEYRRVKSSCTIIFQSVPLTRVDARTRLGLHAA